MKLPDVEIARSENQIPKRRIVPFFLVFHSSKGYYLQGNDLTMRLTLNGRPIAALSAAARAETRHHAQSRSHECILRTEVCPAIVLHEGDLVEIHLDDGEVDALYVALQGRRRGYTLGQPVSHQSPPP